MVEEKTQSAKMFDGKAALEEIERRLNPPRRRTVKEPITNRFQRRGQDPNAGAEAMTKQQFDKKFRNISVHSRITPKGKAKIKSTIENTVCPICNMKSMAIQGRTKDEILVTCTNKFCTNNAHSPLKFNHMQFAAEKKFLPRRITEPMRFW